MKRTDLTKYLVPLVAVVAVAGLSKYESKKYHDALLGNSQTAEQSRRNLEKEYRAVCDSVSYAHSILNPGDSQNLDRSNIPEWCFDIDRLEDRMYRLKDQLY